QEGSLWQFGVEDHGAVDWNRPEAYQCSQPVEPIEVIDVRGWTDEMALRSAITSDGVELNPAPLAGRVLLWLASGLYAGPLLLREAPGGRWVLDGPETPRDAARMPIWETGEGVHEVVLDEVRWFVGPDRKLGRSAGIQNWSPDGQV